MKTKTIFDEITNKYYKIYMEFNTRQIADEVCGTRFDPLICARVHSSTQLKRRLAGTLGIHIGSATPEEMTALRHIDSIPVEALQDVDWPEILLRDLGYEQRPLNLIERIPQDVFRQIRRLLGDNILLTPEVIQQAVALGREACLGQPLSPRIKDAAVLDSWGPFITAPILETARSRGLLQNFAVNITIPDRALIPVMEMLGNVKREIKERFGISDTL